MYRHKDGHMWVYCLAWSVGDRVNPSTHSSGNYTREHRGITYENTVYFRKQIIDSTVTE